MLLDFQEQAPISVKTQPDTNVFITQCSSFSEDPTEHFYFQFSDKPAMFSFVCAAVTSHCLTGLRSPTCAINSCFAVFISEACYTKALFKN